MSSEPLIQYLHSAGAGEALVAQGRALDADEFAAVRNLQYAFAPQALYPLASRVALPLPRVAAFAVDMDGTSTTTEPLALHALEYMVRRFTARPTPRDWPGLDPVADYPHVIGNSNFRHTEFLLARYRDALKPPALAAAFIEALLWTLAAMPDAARRREVRLHAENCGLAGLLRDPDFRRLAGAAATPPAASVVTADNVAALARPFVQRYGPAFHWSHDAELVAAALDIYYTRYHAMLRAISSGEGRRLAGELLGDERRRLVEPMPGYEVFVPLVKGWLGPEAAALAEPLLAALQRGAPQPAAHLSPDAARARLMRLGELFAQRPARLALVTASIEYEARAVMTDIIRQLAERAAHWPISAQRREAIAARLADDRGAFDAFVTASAAHEARLKPHPDLYSIALFEMSIPRDEYSLCVGLEDTEPGIVALRAAGVGCALALPNHDTSRQNYAAAAGVLPGGLPELLLARDFVQLAAAP